MAHVESAGKPAVGAPVQVNRRNFEKQRVIRIVKLHIVERAAPQDRTVYISHFDAKARSRRELANLIEDELTSRRSVQESDCHHDNGQQRGQKPSDTLQDTDRNSPFAARPRIVSCAAFIHGCIVSHQNA